MIGKIIGAIAGKQVADHTRGIGGVTGAILGMGAATMLRRMSLPGLMAVTAGGYLAKKYMDRKGTEERSPKHPANDATPPR